MNARPAVAIVTPTLDIMGGTEQIVGQEARALMDHADVTFFTLDPKPEVAIAADVQTVRSIQLPGVFGTEAWFHAATLAIQTHPKVFDAVYSPGINCACATHINVYANFTQWVALSRGVPIKRSVIELQRRYRFHRLADWEKRLYKNPKTKLATISHSAANRLAQDFGRDDIRVFPSTPQPQRFTPKQHRNRRAAARQQMGLAKDEFVVVTLGNAWHSKGVDMLFECWRAPELAEAATLLLVTTERPEHLEKMCGAKPKGISLLPRQREVEDLYAAADLVILASRGETFGLPIAEAGAMGTPVLVSEHAGVHGYLPPEVVVRPNTTAAWIEAILNIQRGNWSDVLAMDIQQRLQQHDPEQRAKDFVDWVLNT